MAEEEPLVPYGYLIEDEEFVAKYKGFYIVKDGKFYSLNEIISCKKREEYNVGKQITLEDHYDIIKLEPDDEIRSYGVSNVEITKLESLGYGFRREMCGDSGVGVNVDDEWEDAVTAALCGEAELKQIFYRSKRRDGTYALLTTRAFVLSDSNGAPEYFGGIIIPQ